jgi:hypothetical protein
VPKIFVPTGFEANSVSPDLYSFLYDEFDDNIYLLLEFHSLGRRRRQIDVAVLGPYGIDVVEVKAKVGGAIIASENGPWRVQRADGSSEEIPLNGAARENPYQQARNTADDLKRWLSDELGIRTRVYPLVLVPQYHRASNLRNVGFVWTANGLGDFKNSLRSQRPYKDPASLTVDHWDRIVNALALSKLGNIDDTAPSSLTSEPVTTQIHTVEVQTALPKDDVTSTPYGDAVPLPSLHPEPEIPREPGVDASPTASKPLYSRLSIWLGLAAIGLAGIGWTVFAPDTPASPTAATVVTPSTPSTEADNSVNTEEPAGEALPGVAYEADDEEVSASNRAESLDGSNCPASHPVKGNINTDGEKIFHLEDQEYYEITNPEACFSSPQAALAGGFRASFR